MPPRTKKSSTANSNRPIQVNNPPNVAGVHTVSSPPENVVSSSNSINGHFTGSHVEADSRTGDTTESAGEPTPTPAVNRKKQKRREKEAAKRVAEQQLTNGHTAVPAHSPEQIPAVKQGRGPTKGYFTEEPDYVDEDFQDNMGEPEDAFYSGDEDGNYPHDYVEDPNNSWLNTSKRKKGPRSRQSHSSHMAPSRISSGVVRSHLPSLSNAAIRSAHNKMSNEHIWNTSTQAERENIKQFWLELGEEERRSLVKVEKEAVLRKMKEQQKHSCSCSVCGRKRTAIEEELEVLYDAYYEELEQFANHNGSTPSSPRVMPPPRAYRPVRGQVHPMAGSYPVTGRIRELGDNGEELDDEDDYDDEEEDEDEEDEDEDEEEPYSDEDFDDELPPGPPDFFQFGNSLTVKDGILTVADDLLKNDGKHFIDMMEQLAERRMQREEEIHYPAPPLAHQNMRQGHNHPPIDDDDDYDDEEDDEDYDSQEDDDYEGDEMVQREIPNGDNAKCLQDSMTEEQRMEEGRRMFQIFAARMFEQRVLNAYREKVADERTQKLLEELDEESRLDTQREAKKAKEAAKKKEKKARQKAIKEEEKARKDAEKAAQEAEAKAAEERKLEEQRKRKEEQRKKREAERKAAEEDRIRKEADKQKRAQEERERQAENEKRQREAREKEKRKKDDARKKEKEDREAKEKEVRDKRSKEDKERKAREEQSKAQRMEFLKSEKEHKSKTEPVPRPQPVAIPPGLQHPSTRHPPGPSPHLPIAAPSLPVNISTPGRSRQVSQPSQQSLSSSPKSQKASTDTSHASASPASVTLPHQSGFGQSTKLQGQQPMLHHPQPSAPRSPLNNIGRGGHFPYPMNGMPGLGVNGPPPGVGMMHGMMPPMPMYPGGPAVNQQRFGPNGVGYPPPGFGAPRQFQHHHPMSYQPPPPQPLPPQNAGPIGPPPIPIGKPSNHARQPSGSEQQTSIARPGPIARPSSTTPDKQKSDDSVDQITTQLGSKALLDDSDEPIIGSLESRSNLPILGAPGSGRLPFANSFGESNRAAFSVIPNPVGSWNSLGSSTQAVNWGSPGPRSGGHWPQQPFGGIGGGPVHVPRSHAPRPIAVRRWLVQACLNLSALGGGKADGFFPVDAVLQQVNNLNTPGDPPVSREEMLQMCDTEGSVQNGGGSFEVVKEKNGDHFVKFTEDNVSGPARPSLGDIGSPLPTHSPIQPPPFGSIGQNFGPPGRHF